MSDKGGELLPNYENFGGEFNFEVTPRERSMSNLSKSVPQQSFISAHKRSEQQRTNNNGTFSLDTDLAQMEGIVLPKSTRIPAVSADRKSFSKPDVARTGTAWTAPESWGVEEMTVTMVNSMSEAPVARTGRRGTAPESWGVEEMTATMVNSMSEAPLVTTDLSSMNGVLAKKKANHCVRVFREDGTFGTLYCALDITVGELLQLLGRKFFLSSIAGYQLSARTGGVIRVLKPNEKPLVYQKMLLEFMGYTENDRLNDVGREDLSYLCRLEFTRLSQKTFSVEEDALMARDFSHINLSYKNLQTIPIILFQHALDIEILDVSKNPSLSLPLDFIQSCKNLKILKSIDNHIRIFPNNYLHAPNLRELDLSNNLILDIDSVDFSKLQNLTSLSLQGNSLWQISNNLAQLTNLKYLNLSSNNLTQLPGKLCDIRTLVELDLSFNHISSLPENIGQLINLEKLSMTNNDLNKELPKSFKRLLSLRELDVRYNKLQNIDLLSELPNLEVLYCSKNSVYSFDDTFHKLRMFYFDRNPITRIMFTNVHLSLTVLNLSKAKLATLHESFLEKIPMVERLVLDKNHLVTLPPQIGTLHRLISLSLYGNELAVLPPEIGQLSELQVLDLHSNNLKSLPDEVWNLSSLAVLNVSSNLLESFPKHSAIHIAGGSMSSNGPSRQLYRNRSNNSSNSGVDSNYEIRTLADRRESEFSTNTALSPKETSAPSRRASTTTNNISNPSPGGSIAIGSPLRNNSEDQQQPNGRGRRGIGQSLLVLSLADNRLSDDCFEEISLLSELQVLNLSYNDLMEVPYGALGRLTRLTELYLSGNRLGGLPADDFEHNQALRVFHVNANKLHSLPAELGKISHLKVLDVGSNSLRYNINNWPYDWNWNFNSALTYLNLSGNSEIRNQGTT